MQGVRVSPCTSVLKLKKQYLFTFPQEKLKGSLPLTAIEAVLELPGDTTSFKVTGGFTYPLILQASSKEKCQEWIKAIENG